MPVQPRLQIQLVKLKPGLLVEAAVESENGQLLPDLEIRVPIVHEKNIPVPRRRPQLHARPQILSIENREQLLQNHGRQKLRVRLLPIDANHPHHGLRAEGARLPGLQIGLYSLRRRPRVLVALSQIETGDIDLLVPAPQLYPALQGRNRIRPVPHTEVGLAEIEMCPRVVRHLLQILLEQADVTRILVRLAAPVPVVNEHRRIQTARMLVRRTGPGLVRGPLTNPRLRAAHDAHVAVNEAPRRLLQRYTGLLGAQGGQRRAINLAREHHIAVQNQRPGLGGIPAHRPDPVLAAQKRLGATGAEVLKRVLIHGARNVIRLEPGRGLLHCIVRGASVTEHDGIYPALYRVHEALNNAGLVLHHAQKNELVVGHFYLSVLSVVCLYASKDRDELK